ncbi:MAG TPA: DUF4010 domain-containing protein, partial [Gemmatimonadales bacterium]|nr:DUF4010 domain-containing protein [Gemmatimonadales bacterium]
APRLVPFVLPPFLVGLAFIVTGLRRVPASEVPHPQASRSPLRLLSALLMAIAFQATLMVMELARGRFGEAGVLASSAVLGLTDMDALTFSMTRLAAEPDMIAIAATAMAIGVLANTVLKLGVTLVVGTGEFRRRAGVGLVLLAAASAVGLGLGHP